MDKNFVGTKYVLKICYEISKVEKKVNIFFISKYSFKSKHCQSRTIKNYEKIKYLCLKVGNIFGSKLCLGTLLIKNKLK